MLVEETEIGIRLSAEIAGDGPEMDTRQKRRKRQRHFPGRSVFHQGFPPQQGILGAVFFQEETGLGEVGISTDTVPLICTGRQPAQSHQPLDSAAGQARDTFTFRVAHTLVSVQELDAGCVKKEQIYRVLYWIIGPCYIYLPSVTRRRAFTQGCTGRKKGR